MQHRRQCHRLAARPAIHQNRQRQLLCCKQISRRFCGLNIIAAGKAQIQNRARDFI